MNVYMHDTRAHLRAAVTEVFEGRQVSLMLNLL